jgi:hypothetical protein
MGCSDAGPQDSIGYVYIWHPRMNAVFQLMEFLIDTGFLESLISFE